MEKKNATPQFPLAFFEHFLLGIGYRDSLDDFYSIAENEFGSLNINKKTRSVKYYENGEEFEWSYNRDYIFQILKREFNKSLELINEYVLEHCNTNEDTYRYLNIQANKIQYFVNNCHTRIKKVPITMPPLRGIVKIINEVYSPYKDKPFTLNEEILNTQNNNLIQDIQEKKNVDLEFSEHSISKQKFYIHKKYDNIQFFKKLATLAVKHTIIKAASSKNFKAVFFSKNGKHQVRFICNNIKAIQFLENISPIFQRYSARIIEESESFLTKQKSPFTETIYNSTKSRNKKAPELTDMKYDIKDLLDGY